MNKPQFIAVVLSSLLVVCCTAEISIAAETGASPCMLKKVEAGKYVVEQIKIHKTSPLTEENACKIVKAYDTGLEKLQAAEEFCIKEYKNDVAKQGFRNYMPYGVYSQYREMIRSRANYAIKCPSAGPVTTWQPRSYMDIENETAR